MLEYKNITKYFNDKLIVDNLNLKIETGTVLGFIGPNGAGKTTTIKMGCGLVNSTTGEIYAFGKSIKENRKEYIKNIGAVLEGNRNIYWKLTPKENLEYFSLIRGKWNKNIRKNIEHLLELFDLTDKANCECGKLSRGMQQKVAICCSLISDHKILFLDEPTLGLDVQSILSMENAIKKLSTKDKIIIITSHDFNFITNTCNKVAIMDKGNIVLEEEVSFLKNYTKEDFYKININGNLLEIENIFDEFENIKLSAEINGDILIEAIIENNDQLFFVLNTLKDNNIKINSINKQEIALEDIFINIIKEREN
ncbi:ABC transporter ATP-binding protein [uncultured Clostridium sp.]|uniref:ABC transporter ATP-binding protein n=1 Tax=uncultured Clostridium sp. TaxID=59620 RepID=UPI00258DE594|nr:ABC transporter ATP-binding protein [uncultured Clostridium sp.]MDU1349383.1 ABC transporter ATP-binding protein [Clostridium argentinense]